MATVTAGNKISFAISGDQTVDISVNHNNVGRVAFAPTNAGSVPGDGGAGATFGPLPVSKTYGPFGIAGTLTIYCDVGTVTYTVNPSAFPYVNIGSLSFLSTLDNVSIGALFPQRVNTSNLTMTSFDASGSPSTTYTINTPRGRIVIPAGSSTVTVTNSLVTASSSVFIDIINGVFDATCTNVRGCPFAGAFNAVGNAAATSNVIVDFLVVN